MTPKHNNSFDFLRLLFALMVIVTHSYVLSGAGDEDWLFRLTDGQTNCSYIGVRGFFVISGLLIFKSLQRSTSVFDYLKKRLLRIFPALIVMLLVIAFIIGPAFAQVSFSRYFNDYAPLRYIGTALRLPLAHKATTLPGLFAHNPATAAVNGSLWTIWFELLFYALLLLIFPWRRNDRALCRLLPPLWAALFLVFLCAHSFLDRHIFPLTGMSAEVAVDLALYFMGGAALSLVNWQVRWRRWLLGFAGAALVAVGLWLHQFHVLRYLALPLLVLSVGHLHLPVLMQVRRLGEPSYGIYIYAYPVQQLIIQLSMLSPAWITAFAVPACLLLGYASWHLVEAPLLSLKKGGNSSK